MPPMRRNDPFELVTKDVPADVVARLGLVVENPARNYWRLPRSTLECMKVRAGELHGIFLRIDLVGGSMKGRANEYKIAMVYEGKRGSRPPYDPVYRMDLRRTPTGGLRLEGDVGNFMVPYSTEEDKDDDPVTIADRQMSRVLEIMGSCGGEGGPAAAGAGGDDPHGMAAAFANLGVREGGRRKKSTRKGSRKSRRTIRRKRFT
jgi:hypothetical protein